MTNCIPDSDGRRCTECEWEWKYWPQPFPRRNCPASINYEAELIVPRVIPGQTYIQMGPGTELKLLLKRFFIQAHGDCKCNQRAALMDEQGPSWCEENIDVIVGWLQEEATNRHLPFIDTAGRLLVRRAISNARKKERLAR